MYRLLSGKLSIHVIRRPFFICGLAGVGQERKFDPVKQSNAMSNTINRVLERIPDQAKIGGVCAGLADYFGIDRTLVRVLFLIGIPAPFFPALLIYVILWIILPERKPWASPAYLSTEPLINQSSMNPYPSNNSNSNKSGSVVGGIVLIGLGVLFLLDQWFDIDLGDLWPLILIAVGVWLLFKDRIMKNGSPFNMDRTDNEPPKSNDPVNPL
jgi:phage shock protein C